MILKTKDSHDDQIREMGGAVESLGPGRERERLEKDLACVRAGLKGELEAAYHIDFHLKDSPNWAVIHDLRIEWNGRVAQIDHLLIDRFLEIYVVESKSFRTKVRFANGGWERLNFNHWEGIPSPVEQNERHILVLREMIDQLGFAPTRLGMVLAPTFFNFVVVQPSCSIIGSFPREVRIHRMDDLVAVIRNSTPSPLGIMKVIAPETLTAFANHLVACHKPAPKPKLFPSKTVAGSIDSVSGQFRPDRCQGCGGNVSGAEAEYCRARAARFAGQRLCRSCQRSAPELMPVSSVARSGIDAKPIATCAQCGSPVDAKVVAFCRFNGKRFARQVLCQACQRHASKCDSPDTVSH